MPSHRFPTSMLLLPLLASFPSYRPRPMVRHSARRFPFCVASSRGGNVLMSSRGLRRRCLDVLAVFWAHGHDIPRPRACSCYGVGGIRSRNSLHTRGRRGTLLFFIFVRVSASCGSNAAIWMRLQAVRPSLARGKREEGGGRASNSLVSAGEAGGAPAFHRACALRLGQGKVLFPLFICGGGRGEGEHRRPGRLQP